MKQFILLFIGMFSLGLDAYITTGLLSGIGSSFGTNAVQNAQTVTIFTLCYAVSGPLFSTLCMRWPLRKTLVLSLLVFSIANIISALSISWMMLMTARAIAGIGAGLFSTMASLAAVLFVTTQRKGRALGVVFTGMSAGVVIGVPVGLFIASSYGWQCVFWLITFIGLISMTGIYLYFPNLETPQIPTMHERLKVLNNNNIIFVIGTTFSIAMLSLGLYTYIPLLLQETIGGSYTILYLWGWGIGGVLASLCIGEMIDKVQNPRWLLSGILLILMVTLCSIPSLLSNHHVYVALLLFLIWGAMGWSYMPLQQHVLFSLSSNQHKGSIAVAFNSSCNYLGGSIGTLLAGSLLILGYTPLQFPYFSALVCCLIFIFQITMMIQKS